MSERVEEQTAGESDGQSSGETAEQSREETETQSIGETAKQTSDESGQQATCVRVPRWRAAVPAALSLVTLGLLYASPLLLAAAAIPLGYVVYGSLSAVPADASVQVERSFEDGSPAPGERTTVSVTVTNDSDVTMPDIRIVDGVPAELAVVDGSPRRSLSLRPGESATFSYAVVGQRGTFVFDEALVRLRSLAGSAVLTESVPVAGAERLSFLHPLTGASIEASALQRAGTHSTDSGGEGTEFYATRDYRPGDPKNRIHWRRFARTGELTTVAYREERGVSTVVIVDARPAGRVSPRPGVPTGVGLCGYAGERLYQALTDAGVITSVAALGTETDDPSVPVRPGGFPWADGDADDATTLARAVFETIQRASDPQSLDVPAETANGRRFGTVDAPTAGASNAGTTQADDSTDSADEADGGAATDPASTADAGTPAPDGGAAPVELILSYLPSDAEVVLVTPLLDDWPVSLVETLRTQAYPVTVVSPDVTETGSVGGSVAGVERRARLRDLGVVGATTVGWTPGDSLEVALARSVTHLVGRDQ